MQKLKILWYKFRAGLISTFVNLFASQTNHDIKNTILLIGSTRSGTTFMMESLNSMNDFRLIFEPFNPSYTKEWKSYKARHYINPDNINIDERQKVDNILRGRVANKWVDRYNRKIRSKKRLVKSVRANLMLDYLENEYPEMSIIYMHRNPYDVVASRMNISFDPKDVYLILKHKEFLRNHYSDIDITALKSLFGNPESCHAALWCFENRFILQSMSSRRIIEANYKDVIGKTITFDGENLVISDKVRRPSVTTSIQRSYQLTEEEKKNISAVLEYFGMVEYLR